MPLKRQWLDCFVIPESPVCKCNTTVSDRVMSLVPDLIKIKFREWSASNGLEQAVTCDVQLQNQTCLFTQLRLKTFTAHCQRLHSRRSTENNSDALSVGVFTVRTWQFHQILSVNDLQKDLKMNTPLRKTLPGSWSFYLNCYYFASSLT